MPWLIHPVARPDDPIERTERQARVLRRSGWKDTDEPVRAVEEPEADDGDGYRSAIKRAATSPPAFPEKDRKQSRRRKSTTEKGE